jgi:hypothetical protein
MGSFLTQCAVTHQSIQEQQPCVIIPIFQNNDYSLTTVIIGKDEVKVRAPFDSTCYYNAFWNEFGLPLRGKYNDYGTFVLTEDAHNMTAMMYFLAGLDYYALKVVAGNNPVHQKAVDVQALIKDRGFVPSSEIAPTWDVLHSIWEELEEHFHDNRMFINHHNQPALLTRFVVSETAYDALADIYENTPDWNGKNPRLKELYWSEYVKAFEKLEAEIAEIANDPELSATEITQEIAELKAERRFFDNSDKLKFFFGDYGSFHNPVFSRRQLGELLLSLSRIQGLQESQVSFYYYLKYANFISGLETIGIRLSPMVYTGQDYGNDCGHMYGELVKRVVVESRKSQKERHAEWGDGDEEYDENKLSFPV